MIGDVLPRERPQFPCGWSGGLRSTSSEYGNLATTEHQHVGRSEGKLLEKEWIQN